MKNILFTLLFLTSAFNLSAQQEPTVVPCWTDEKTAEYALLPEYQQNYLQSQLAAANETPIVSPKGTVYKIPVVFHILHDGGVNNISREQVLDALRILNEDYRLQNPDANMVASVFDGSQADIEIEFVLATKAPDGTCFMGITRTYNPIVSNDGDLNQVEAIRDGNDVYNSDWPGDMYLNIFVVGSISTPGSSLITLGYTTYPQWGGLSMGNGFHVIHDAVGSIGTSGGFDESTSSHEIGHWLNLRHTWGNSNSPSESENCDEDDLVDDTPRCAGIQGGSCSSTNPNPLNSCDQDNGYWGFDIQDQIENYMDYSHCGRMFSEGQKQRMRDALESSVGGRNNLWSAQNIIDTGADGNIYLCKAVFDADKTTICAGGVINFTDGSFNVVNGWTWSFPGGSPASSSIQNPVVTYNIPGIYEVALIATDGLISNSEVKTAYIRVLPASQNIPILEGFETYSTLNNINEWEVKNEEGEAFEINNSIGLNSQKCVSLMNNGEAEGSYDELISTPVDLSGVANNITLSFRYAYKRKNENDDDWFRVFVSNDCEASWVIRKTMHGFQLSSDQQSTPFTPGSEDDWTTVHMTNISSNFFVDNFRYKFQFQSGEGNNFYLDNINMYEGSPSDELVSLSEEEVTILGLNLYPNPADEELNIVFTVANEDIMQLTVQDVSGKQLKSNTIKALSGSNHVLIDTKDLANGMYFIRLNSAKSSKVAHFIVK
ncbi:MAG: M43 family zinc metalloprotease [Crocinitomicaceae bacterium]